MKIIITFAADDFGTSYGITLDQSTKSLVIKKIVYNWIELTLKIRKQNAKSNHIRRDYAQAFHSRLSEIFTDKTI